MGVCVCAVCALCVFRIIFFPLPLTTGVVARATDGGTRRPHALRPPSVVVIVVEKRLTVDRLLLVSPSSRDILSNYVAVTVYTQYIFFRTCRDCDKKTKKRQKVPSMLLGFLKDEDHMSGTDYFAAIIQLFQQANLSTCYMK